MMCWTRANCKGDRAVGVATGEHADNSVMLKQYCSPSTFLSIYSCRLGGVTRTSRSCSWREIRWRGDRMRAAAVSASTSRTLDFDFIGIAGTMEGRVIEFVDHLHEHFEEPVTVRGGRYLHPMKPGYSITIKADSRRRYRFPDGEIWRDGH